MNRLVLSPSHRWQSLSLLRFRIWFAITLLVLRHDISFLSQFSFVSGILYSFRRVKLLRRLPNGFEIYLWVLCLVWLALYLYAMYAICIVLSGKLFFSSLPILLTNLLWRSCISLLFIIHAESMCWSSSISDLHLRQRFSSISKIKPINSEHHKFDNFLAFKPFLTCNFILWVLNSFDLPSYGSESRKRYSLKQLVSLMRGEEEFAWGWQG